MDNTGPGPSNDGQFSDFSPVENPWRIKHPVVTFFHLLFRTLALIGKQSVLTEITDWPSLPSISPVWLVLRQFHRQLRGHHSTSLHGFLDSEEHHRSHHGWTAVVELCG